MFLERLRRRFRFLGTVGSAVSRADTGPYAGAPRDPDLSVDDGGRAYSVVKYTTNQVAYTSTTSAAAAQGCERCGRPVAETHGIEQVGEGAPAVAVGSVRTCRSCEGDSWLRRSHMPGAARARARSRRIIV